MNIFCKEFRTIHGQVVFLKTTNDETEQPSVRIFFEPKDMGICEMSINFNDNENGYNNRDKTFNEVTQDNAHLYVEKAALSFK